MRLPMTIKAGALVALAFSPLPACDGLDPAEGDGELDSFISDKADTGALSEGSADAAAVLAVANTLGEAELETEAGLARRAARAITAARAGTDGVPGTDDDRFFASLRQLDDVPWVGPVALSRLRAFARSIAPPAVANLYGFASQTRVAAQGGGTNTQNIGPSYQCHRKTQVQLPCGGWVSLVGHGAQTEVVLGVLGHAAYYQYVSGEPNPAGFPPPPSNRFWAQTGVVTLDAAGRGTFATELTDAQGTPTHQIAAEVTATQGAVSVAWRHTIWPSSRCNSYEETCAFTALGQAP